MNPPTGQTFRAVMTIQKNGSLLTCWRDKNKAFEWLEEHYKSDGNYGVVQSTLERLQTEIETQKSNIEIKVVE
jgi:hypothetical protein